MAVVMSPLPCPTPYSTAQRPFADLFALDNEIVDTPTRVSFGVLPPSLDATTGESANNLPTSVASPKEVATALTTSFTKTLQFQTQRTMFADFALTFITVYGDYFHERKRIIDMKSSSAAPKCCSREIPFQPLDRVKEDLACTVLQADIAAATIRLNSEAGSLYLRGLLLNNDARKAEAIKIFAHALPEFARLIAIECDVKEGLEHDMVADYLLQHHHSALNMLNIPVLTSCRVFSRYTNESIKSPARRNV